MSSGLSVALQLCDLLMTCGLSVEDSLLPQLLHFADFESGEIRRLSSLVQEHVKAASREILEACVLHSSRSYFCLRAAPRPVSRCTRHVLSGIAKRSQEVLKFRMMDGRATAYLLSIPGAGKLVVVFFLPFAQMAVALWCSWSGCSCHGATISE